MNINKTTLLYQIRSSVKRGAHISVMSKLKRFIFVGPEETFGWIRRRNSTAKCRAKLTANGCSVENNRRTFIEKVTNRKIILRSQKRVESSV